jgi:putative restriction endonuclease
MNWTRDELLAALHLYLQLPFGQLHRGQPRIVQLARWLGRTPSSVAMKLVNIASLDPAITGTGRAGLKKASQLDRDVWIELTASWSTVANEAATAYEALAAQDGLTPIEADRIASTEFPDVEPETSAPTATEREARVKVRISQVRFRRWVLASYGGRCCVTGLQEPRLLIASHIVPWSESPANRMNPRNGLCLSPLYDRAFDQGLITITPGSLKIRVSQHLREAVADAYVQQALVALDGVPIRPPERFRPDDELLAWHQKRYAQSAGAARL